MGTTFRYLALTILTSAAFGQQPPADSAQLTKTLNDLVKRANHTSEYSWDGEISVAMRQGQGPFMLVAKSKVQMAAGKDGKSLIKIRPENGDEYWIVSDGKKTWSYLPSKKAYVEEELASTTSGDDSEEEPEEREGTFSERYARKAVQNIADFARQAASINPGKPTATKFENKKVTWPTLVVTGKAVENRDSTVAELVMAPDRPVLAQLGWAEIHRRTEGQTVLRVNIQFDSFSVGDPVANSLFTFDPPKKAKLVEELAIPGQAGSALLNHPSPDFETRTLTGEKVKLSELKGKVVMLNFWASWCPPCRAELPTVAKLAAEMKDKGVVTYGVNDEGRGTAQKYLDKAGLALPTLDDSSQKAHRLYRVNSIPTVFVISANGTIVKWYRGAHNEESLRAALKAAGVAN